MLGFMLLLLFSEQFSVQPGGSLILQSSLDYEDIPAYNLTIAAVDSGISPMTGTANLIINVLDVNDNPPSITTTQTVFATTEVTMQQ
jgi:hypothetical protein